MLPALCPAPVKGTEMEVTLKCYVPVTPNPTLNLFDGVSKTEIAAFVFFKGEKSKKVSMG